jgi:CDP-glucose 4,6-dehydratase
VEADLVRGFAAGQSVVIRRPHAIRPWQHVLEPLHGYILLAEQLLGSEATKHSTAYNFGPSDDDAQTVEWIVERMTQAWGDGASWHLDAEAGVHEAGYLKLDASRARAELGWAPKLRLAQALDWLVAWYRAHQAGADMQAFTLEQIAAYEALT